MEVGVGSRAFVDLCTDLSAISTSTYDAATTTNGSNASGQKVVNVNSTTSFTVGEMVILDPAGTKEEVGRIASHVTNTSLTLETDLVNTHADATVVRQGWYNYSVDALRDWDLLWLMDEQIQGNVLAGAILGEEHEVGFETMAVTRRQHFQAVVMKREATQFPYDHANLRVYEKIKMDMHKAIFGWAGVDARYLRGNHALDTRIATSRPLDRADFALKSDEEVAMSRTAYVGCLISGYFDVRHRPGDRSLEI